MVFVQSVYLRTMNYFRQIIFIFFAAITSIAILPYFKIFGVIPNLIFLIMLSFLYLGEEKIALVWAALGGILLDLVSPMRFGLAAISFFLVYLVNLFLLKRVFHSASSFISILAILSNALIINIIFAYFLNSPIALVLITSIYDFIAGILIYYTLLKFLNQKTQISI